MQNISFDMTGRYDLRVVRGSEVEDVKRILNEKGKKYVAVPLNVILTKPLFPNVNTTHETVVANQAGDRATITHTIPYYYINQGRDRQSYPLSKTHNRPDQNTMAQNAHTVIPAHFKLAENEITAGSALQRVRAVEGPEETLLESKQGLFAKRRYYRMPTAVFRYLHVPVA